MSQVLGWVVVVVVLGAAVGCSPNPEVPPTEQAQLPTLDEPLQDPKPAQKTEFATGGKDDKDAKIVEVKFDSERALKYLKQLCDIGPRISGTEGMKKQQELIEAHFKKLGATVTRQEFKAKQKSRKNQTEFVNLIISWHPDKERRVLLCSHYDTRPIADQEANPANWNKPFVSANDGTSGVAFLMELGHHMKDLKCEFGVDFVLFDGEEYVFETNALGGGDRYFIGSDHFADEYAKSKGTRKYRYDAGVLFDLFAGKNADLKVELNSFQSAKPLVDQIWGVAKAVGAKSFKYERGYEVQDDHLALNRVGIPAVDIIDFDYPHWHKLSDTADKIDGAQLAEVAKVITTWLQKIK
jgi:glutaminyl-peptide cyclotransferase